VDKEMAAQDKEHIVAQQTADEIAAAALAAAKMVCSRANPGACDMCGS
jgi:hypothetical protein